MSKLKPVSDAVYRRVCESREFFELFIAEVCRASIKQGAEAMRMAVLSEFERWFLAKESNGSFVRSLQKLPIPKDEP
jgi:hypothetical protein